MFRWRAVTCLSLLLLEVLGCQFGAKPRVRLGSYPSSIVGMKFLDPGELGPHGYRFNLSEKNGIVYTCKAGHIDIAHLRIAADWTAYLAARTFECLMKNDTGFSFKLNVEPCRYFVQITHPENWKDLPQTDKEQIAHDISIKLGQYLAYTATTWHEVLTWFGYKCIGFIPEFQSAFSWEDSFSNVLGTRLAGQALREPWNEFDRAMTVAIDQELDKLGAQSSGTARRATKNAHEAGFSGHRLFAIDVRKRNFDIGLHDGYVAPTIVPSVCECEGAEAQAYPVPNLSFLSKHGFSVKVEIEPREWEKGKILRIVYPDANNRRKRLEPVVHLAQIMDYIKEDAAKRYGCDAPLGQ